MPDHATVAAPSERHPSAAERDWTQGVLEPALAKAPERPIGARSGVNVDAEGNARFTTISGTPIERLYTEADLPPDFTLPMPGQPPYTRGIHPTGYRGKLWTMRQFSGFATPEETNLRYKYLLAQGGDGLSVAFDLPTLMGYDSDDAESEGEVGKCGVAIDSLEDMEILFSGIDLENVTVSMTINSPASVLWAMYLVVAEKTGRGLEEDLRHTAERHPEGVHRAEGVHLSSGAVDAAGDRYLRVRFAPHAALQSHLHLRLPHPRSRLDRAAGAGLHSLRRRRIRRVGVAPRTRHR